MWWRYAAGGGAILAAAVAGVMALNTEPTASRPMMASQPSQTRASDASVADTDVPEASAATREEKRFARYDKDRDAAITREEYLAARRKAFAKLDVDRDGRLSFDEWAIKATTKFAAADGDKSGTMNAAEFVTTAVKRKPASRPKCPPQSSPAEEG